MTKIDKYSVLLIILVLFGIGHPSLMSDYLYTDDYLYFFPKINDVRYETYLTSEVSNIWNYAINVGRPFLYYFILIGNSTITKVSDAILFRAIALAGLALFSVLTYIWLIRNNQKVLHSICIVIFVVSTPSTVLAVSWITMNLGIYSILLASIAAFLVEKGLNSKGWHYYFIAVIVMTISLNGYLPYGMGYWFYVLIKVINIDSKDKSKARSILLPFYIVGLSSMVLYFLIGKLILNFGGGLETRILWKIYWTITEPILYSLNFNFLFPNAFFSIFVALVIAYGLFSSFIHIYNDRNRQHNHNLNSKLLIKQDLSKLILVIFTVFLSFSPIILSSYSTNSHRILLVLKSCFIILFFYGIKNILSTIDTKISGKMVNCIFVTCFALSASYAYYINENYLANPQKYEYQYLKNDLESKLTKNVSHIHLVRPPWWTGDVPYNIPEGFDIGVYSSSVSSNTKNMVIAALDELSITYQKMDKVQLFKKKYIISSKVPDLLKRSQKDESGKMPTGHNVLIVNMAKSMIGNKDEAEKSL